MARPSIHRPKTEYTPLQSRIMSDRLRAMSEQVVAVSLVSPLGLGCAAYAMLDAVPRERVILWLIIAGLAHATAIALGLIYLRKPRSAAENGLWMQLFTLRALLTGSAWGASTLIMWPTERFEYQAVLVMFLVGFSTISTLTNSALRRCVLASFLGTWTPAVWRMAISDDPLHHTIAIMLLTFSVIMLASMLRFSRQLLEATRWRFENAELAETLQQEQRRVDAANRSKSRFLAAASHDLRQPVHALGFFLQTMRLTAERPQPDRAKLAEITRQAQSTLNGLTGLLDTLLDFSRLEAGTIPAELQPIALKPVLATLAQQFTERARRKGLKLRVRPCILSVRSNPVGLQRILGNLVENAIRYSDRGGVLVGCRIRGNQLLIQVWDTGQGIPSNETGRDIRRVLPGQRTTGHTRQRTRPRTRPVDRQATRRPARTSGVGLLAYRRRFPLHRRRAAMRVGNRKSDTGPAHAVGIQSGSRRLSAGHRRRRRLARFAARAARTGRLSGADCPQCGRGAGPAPR